MNLVLPLSTASASKHFASWKCLLNLEDFPWCVWESCSGFHVTPYMCLQYFFIQ